MTPLYRSTTPDLPAALVAPRWIWIVPDLREHRITPFCSAGGCLEKRDEPDGVRMEKCLSRRRVHARARVGGLDLMLLLQHDGNSVVFGLCENKDRLKKKGGGKDR